MDLKDFDYHLPPERIAQVPLKNRDESRLLHLDRTTGHLTHIGFKDLIELLNPGDVLVTNNSRVIPARLFGKKETGGRVELLLLRRLDRLTWEAMVGGKKIKVGTSIEIEGNQRAEEKVKGTVTAELDGPLRHLQFDRPTEAWLQAVGHMPLPPYIHTALPIEEAERYQTVYNRIEGSAAAPTAGLHFTGEILHALRDKGVYLESVTLHVGLDTFKPVSATDVTDHTIHTESISLTPQSAERINKAKLAGGRIIAVGTTSMRVLETAALRSEGHTESLREISRTDRDQPDHGEACPWRPVIATEETTDLYIYPGYRFRVVDGLVTNFHMPKSTLVMLVSAFAGRENLLQAYQAAIDEKYRFLSFGDAMFIG